MLGCLATSILRYSLFCCTLVSEVKVCACAPLSHPSVQVIGNCLDNVIPYSRKYWRELNLAVEPNIAIARILVNLNLAVQYGIAIHIYASRKFWRL